MNKMQITTEKRYFSRGNEPHTDYMEFADFVIDGLSLYSVFKEHDYISCLGWGSIDYQNETIGKLLLKVPSEFESGRNCIYVCPLCADFGCGVITINIEKEGSTITWKDFRLEDTYKVRNKIYEIGPFVFDSAEYGKVLKTSIGIAGFGWP